MVFEQGGVFIVSHLLCDTGPRFSRSQTALSQSPSTKINLGVLRTHSYPKSHGNILTNDDITIFQALADLLYIGFLLSQHIFHKREENKLKE